MNIDVLVVGAGFAGSVVAERLASAGLRVHVVEKRDHVGGNAYDEYDSHGILIHKYGPHIFHTNSKEVFEYLSQFTEWRTYEHRVLAKVGKQLLPIPINRTTINRLYNLELDEEGVQKFFEENREPRNPVVTSEDVVLNTVGRDLYNKFFKGYTKKQWGIDASKLNASVTARIPVRTNTDDRYFTDVYQKMPLKGYTYLFKKMLNHPLISVDLSTDFFNIKNKIRAKHIIYTGPIDAYFHFCLGKLPYRSLHFEHEHFPDIEQYQPVGTVNFPNDYDYTRITEFKHLTGQKHPGTSIVKEYPRSEGDPYYPVPKQDSLALFQKYNQLAQKEKNVTFVGRLAQYRYYNMDQVVLEALKISEELLKNRKRNLL